MRTALILSGCGYLDGAEIHESVLCLLALAERGHEFYCFAPDILQRKVMNHLSRKEMDESRNVLIEAARIARGKIFSLSKLSSEDFDALLLPGGFGVASNLSTFGEEKDRCSVDEECKGKIMDFYHAKKPIGALCISPAILGKIFQNEKSILLTLGKRKESNVYLENMGMHAIETEIFEVATDKENKIFSTPAYMEPGDPAKIFKGIKKLILEMEKA